jgi:hypothetical protein
MEALPRHISERCWSGRERLAKLKKEGEVEELEYLASCKAGAA